MEDKFLIAEEISESDRVKGRILKSSIDLSVAGGYFEESGRYKVTIGSRGVEHTRELFQAYENTWK